jgi:hypothetical protein
MTMTMTTRRHNRYGVAYPYQHHMDVESPMLCPDLSGRLQDHFSPCEECGEFHDEPFEPEEDECDGSQRRWGCWYGEDRGLCGSCGADNALVAEMYEGHGDPDSCWVCLACYVRHHKEACGCDKWAWAEKILVLFMPSD